jgi:hypothetical protein
MIDFWELRAELRRLGLADLLQMAFDQKEHHCVLNPIGSCEFYFKYKGFGFCVSELSGRGCQAEIPGLSVDLSIPYLMERLSQSAALKLKMGTERYWALENLIHFVIESQDSRLYRHRPPPPAWEKGDSTGNGLGDS